jgi:hypothetical protein
VEKGQKCLFSCINNTAPNLRAVMVNPNRFYTYVYLREDRTPYYIGKGSGNRINENKGRPCKKPKDKSRVIFLKKNLLEEEAFKHEKYMIAVFGRKDLRTGILHNKTDGGEGCSGFKQSEETKRNHSIKMKGENHPHYGKKGENHPKYGKSHSNDTKRKQSERMIGKNNPMYGKKGETSPSYGKKFWNDGRGNNKLSVECPEEGWVLGMSKEIGKKRSEKIRGENNSSYGKKWWNDGNGNIKVAKECPGPNWVLGKSEKIIRKTVESNIGKTKGKVWWNDSFGNRVRSLECPGEGWVPGMGEEIRKQRSLMKWWNDGCGNLTKSAECPGEGWVSGMGKVKTLF